MAQVPRPLLEVVRSGKVLARHEIPADRELVIGRTEQCAITIQHGSVSRMHAKVWADAAGVYVEDLGSANGTFLDNQRLTAVTRLSQGQQIQVGQRTVDEPVVLRFEDPATRLLQEMGLFAPPPAEERAEQRSAGNPGAATIPNPLPGEKSPAAPKIKQAGPQVPTQPSPLPGGSTATGGTELAAADAGPVVGMPARRLPAWKSPVVWVAALAAVVVFIVATAYLVTRFRPAATRWRSVELAPPQVAPGSQLTLISNDIKADAALGVAIAGQPVASIDRRAGRIQLEVPTLVGYGAGSYDLPLVVSQGKLSVFEGSLRYVVQPRIDAVDPMITAVGKTVTIRGSGLPLVSGQLEVFIGDQPAPVERTSADQVVVRVPMVTRNDLLRLPVRLLTGGMEVTAKNLLVVGPRQPEPLAFAFATRYRDNPSGWEVSGPFGDGTFVIAGGPADTDRVKTRVTSLAGRFSEALARAGSDQDLRILARPRGGHINLETSRGAILFEWTDGELAEALPGTSDASPELVASWLAGVFDQMLEVFGRGRAPQVTPGSPAYLAPLARLVAINRDGGGDGRPEAADLAALRPAEREALASAWASLPPRFGSLTGSWAGTLENVFDRQGGGQITLDLALTQHGRGLSGRATIRFRGSGMDIALPEAVVSGSSLAGSPVRVRLSFTTGRPVGQITLEGELAGEEMSGSFQTKASGSGHSESGTWQAHRTGDG